MRNEPLINNKEAMLAIFGESETSSVEETEWVNKMTTICSRIFIEQKVACHLKATINSPIMLLLIYELDSYTKAFSKIQNITKSLQGYLGEPSARIDTVLGETGFGVYINKRQRPVISLNNVLVEDTISFGLNEYGKSVSFDLNKHVHLLIGGTSGSGKSQLVHAFINSMLLTKTPKQVQFILIDPKRVEMRRYNNLCKDYLYYKKIVTEGYEAREVLYSLNEEMEKRYSLLEKANCFDIEEYNKISSLPHIVLVVEEFGDLMLAYQDKKILENLITSIAQKGRSAGLHLLFATQSPDTKTIPSGIKANFANRVGLKVTDPYKSRVIIDSTGAEKLLGNGDGYYYTNGELIRFQGALVTPEQTKKIIEYLNVQ